MVHHMTPDLIIRIAACHVCASRRGQPCVFSATDDPRGDRAAARDSHADRIQRAKKNLDSALDMGALIP